MLIDLNIRKFFLKQKNKKNIHTHPLHCFANRRSLDESCTSVEENFFLEKIAVTRFIGRLFPLTTLEGQFVLKIFISIIVSTFKVL